MPGALRMPAKHWGLAGTVFLAGTRQPPVGVQMSPFGQSLILAPVPKFAQICSACVALSNTSGAVAEVKEPAEQAIGLYRSALVRGAGSGTSFIGSTRPSFFEWLQTCSAAEQGRR